MQVADALRRLPGVSAVELLMATEANRRALAGSGLWPSDCHAAGITDLVLAVRAAGEAPAHAAVEAAERLLAERPRPDEAPVDEPCRSIRSAIRREPGARFTVVSVPGPYAANEAHQALAAGHHVFIFSDGVTLEEEVRLKRRAAGAGLLVMGPECGTAILDGVGIGFANRVRRGPIGLVGASGTGLQEVTCLLHRLGSGVSQAIGTGGRDLDAMVGGLTTLEALHRLALRGGAWPHRPWPPPLRRLRRRRVHARPPPPYDRPRAEGRGRRRRGRRSRGGRHPGRRGAWRVRPSGSCRGGGRGGP